MSETMAPDGLASRTSRAVAAATAAGRELGLAVTDPTVLHDVFSVIVHLDPSPVVVRVPTVRPRTSHFTLAAQEAQQRAELDLVGWLADRGEPAVAPSPLVPREPVRRDGFSMTFWQLVERDTSAEPDYAHHAAVTAGLHAALRGYVADLSFLWPVNAWVPQTLADLESCPDLIDAADLDRARREWAILEPVVGSRAGFEAAFPGVEVQAIHGDAPSFNLIVTLEGELHSDFEDASLGPVEWDLTLVGPESEAAYNAAASRLGLRPLSERVLRVMESARMLQVVACLALVPRLPLLAEGLKPTLARWRTTPLAGGMG